MSHGIIVRDNNGEVVCSPEGRTLRIVGYATSQIQPGGILFGDLSEPTPSGGSATLTYRFKTIPGFKNDNTWWVMTYTVGVTIHSFRDGGFVYYFDQQSMLSINPAFLIMRMD